MPLALEKQRWLDLLSSRPAGCAQQVLGQLGLCRETMSQTKQNKILNYNHRITHKEHEGTQAWRRKQQKTISHKPCNSIKFKQYREQRVGAGYNQKLSNIK